MFLSFMPLKNIEIEKEKNYFVLFMCARYVFFEYTFCKHIVQFFTPFILPQFPEEVSRNDLFLFY